MIPNVIQKWVDIKAQIFAERDRCLALYQDIKHKIKESCGQDIESLEFMIGVYPYRLCVSYGGLVMTNLSTKSSDHWGLPLSHYRKMLSELQSLTPTEMEFRILKKIETAD